MACIACPRDACGPSLGVKATIARIQRNMPGLIGLPVRTRQIRPRFHPRGIAADSGESSSEGRVTVRSDRLCRDPAIVGRRQHQVLLVAPCGSRPSWRPSRLARARAMQPDRWTRCPALRWERATRAVPSKALQVRKSEKRQRPPTRGSDAAPARPAADAVRAAAGGLLGGAGFSIRVPTTAYISPALGTTERYGGGDHSVGPRTWFFWSTWSAAATGAVQVSSPNCAPTTAAGRRTTPGRGCPGSRSASSVPRRPAGTVTGRGSASWSSPPAPEAGFSGSSSKGRETRTRTRQHHPGING